MLRFCILPLLLTVCHAATLFDLVTTSTAGSPNDTVGYRMQIGTRSLQVTEVGVYDDMGNGLRANNSIGVWVEGGPQVISVTIPTGTTAALAGATRWVRLNTPVILTANTNYVVGCYGVGEPKVVSAQTNADATMLSAVRSNVFTGLVYPRLIDFTTGPIIGVNFSYRAINPPTITQHPQARIAAVGSDVSFSVTATSGTDTSLSYQWNKDGRAMTGATGSTLTLPGLLASDAASYTVTVTDTLGSVASSLPAVLTVLDRPAITAEPQSRTAALGDTITLSVGVTGTGLSYQWYEGTSGVTTTPVVEATQASLTLTVTKTASYWVRVSNAGVALDGPGHTDSAAAVIGVLPRISQQPQSQTVTLGQVVRLSIVAQGAVTYQWYRGISGDTTNRIIGAMSSTYSTNVLRTEQYWVRVGNSYGTVDSGSATVTLGAGPQIATPTVQALSLGRSATLTVGAVGTDLSFQWYRGQKGDTTTPIPGAITATYVTPFESTEASYWVRISGANDRVDSDTLVVPGPASSGANGLVNMSVRVQTNGTQVIPGLVVDAPIRALIRVAGPALARFGVNNTLANPKVTVYAGSVVIGENDDWSTNATTLEEAVTKTGAFPFTAGSKDAALVLDLPVGSYTCVITGDSGTSGEVLLEVYRVP